MRKKQVWTLEHADQAGDSSSVLLRSHLGRYLSSDKDGNVTAECERPCTDCRFCVVAHADGRWSLRSEQHGRYLGGTEDRVLCSTTEGKWYVHLATHRRSTCTALRASGICHAHTGRSELAADRRCFPGAWASVLTLVYRERRVTTCRPPAAASSLAPVRWCLSHRTTLDSRWSFARAPVAFRNAAGRYLAPSGPERHSQGG
ncbi:hypothetical protein Q7C36_021668 [Tachysurus vachellii]|uniref:Fascin-like domain-containing protein n=1 Tax=Tachysurus vachellii TaxID=175792 RepID=A0AA88LPW8_TACVA|nr:hypothetical protein Q7C36_021668 [Tachysurus vachellii]